MSTLTVLVAGLVVGVIIGFRPRGLVPLVGILAAGGVAMLLLKPQTFSQWVVYAISMGIGCFWKDIVVWCKSCFAGKTEG